MQGWYKKIEPQRLPEQPPVNRCLPDIHFRIPLLQQVYSVRS